MTAVRAPRLIQCPECGGAHLSFLEVRRMSVYYRQVPESGPSEKAVRVLVEDEEGALYEEEAQTNYTDEVQGYCHSCGYKWKTPECTKMTEVLARQTRPPKPTAEQAPAPKVAAKAKEAPPRKARSIKAKDLVADIVAGIADTQLMKRYEISTSQLEALLQRLVDKGLVTQQQIDARVNLADTAITKAFVETRKSMHELDYAETQRVDPIEALASVKHEIAPARQPAKPKIKAKQFVKDVEVGMSDPQLMQKYGLGEKQLNSLFQRVVELGLITVEQLYARTSISETSITKAFVEVYQSLQELEE